MHVTFPRSSHLPWYDHHHGNTNHEVHYAIFPSLLFLLLQPHPEHPRPMFFSQCEGPQVVSEFLTDNYEWDLRSSGILRSVVW
jgi:hypothetical protein